MNELEAILKAGTNYLDPPYLTVEGLMAKPGTKVALHCFCPEEDYVNVSLAITGDDALPPFEVDLGDGDIDHIDVLTAQYIKPTVTFSTLLAEMQGMERTSHLMAYMLALHTEFKIYVESVGDYFEFSLRLTPTLSLMAEVECEDASNFFEVHDQEIDSVQ